MCATHVNGGFVLNTSRSKRCDAVVLVNARSLRRRANLHAGSACHILGPTATAGGANRGGAVR